MRNRLNASHAHTNTSRHVCKENKETAVTVYYDQDCKPEVIQGKIIAIIGYGSQGHAHALNLMDSGCDVRVGLREGSSSAQKAAEAGLKVMGMAEAAAEADVIMILTPDETQPKVYEEFIAPNLKAGDTPAFAHGFQHPLRLHRCPEDVNVIMCAPGRDPDISFAVSSPRAPACPIWPAWPKTLPAMPGISPWLIAGVSAAAVPESSRRPLPRRPKRTSLASRLFLCGGLVEPAGLD